MSNYVRFARPLLSHLVLISGAIFLIAPVVLIFVSSTHSSTTLSTEGLQFSFGHSAVQNYTDAFTLATGFTDQITLGKMLANSLIVGTGVAGLTTVLSFCAAYSIVFFRMPWAGFLFWLVLLTLLFPLESRFIPTFGVTADLGLINTRMGIILPVLALSLGTFFFRQYFLTLPGELVEAARMDGAGPLRFCRDILIPLSWARAGAIFTVSFMVGWNQYLWPLMISTNEGLYTLMRGIRLVGQESGLGMALIVLSILPPLVLLLIFQRWFFASLQDLVRED